MHVGATQTRSRRCLWRCIWRVGFFGSQQQVFVRPLRLTNWRGRRNGANREIRRLVRALGLALPLAKSSDAEGDNLFVAIQEDGALPLAEPGAGGARSQALARVVRNLSFAKQRWDSTAGPVAKMALALLPLATLLAYIASDRRHEKPARERAVTLLKKMDSKFCMALGVSADWGIICNWFLRLFDVANRDIALSRSQIDCMVETLDAVFIEGRVFQKIMQEGASGAAAAVAAAAASGAAAEPLPSVGAHGEPPGFITTKVMAHLRRKYVFLAGRQTVLLWGEPRDAHKAELLERVQNAAILTKERLLADFPASDLRSKLAMFDRRLVLKGFGDLPCINTRRFLLRGVFDVAAALGCDQAAAVLAYKDVVPYVLAQFCRALPLAEQQTNQEAWASLLDDACWRDACPTRLVGTSSALRKLIRFYISIEDGECSVERDFACLRGLKGEHRTRNVEFLEEAMMVKIAGPQTVAEFNGGDGSPPSSRGEEEELTPFSRECARLWRQLYGARGGHHNPAATRAAASKSASHSRRGPLRRATVGVLAAARLAVQCKRARAASAALHPGAGTARSARWNDAMGQFHKRSLRNIPGATQVRAAPGGAFLPPAGVDLCARRGARAPPAAPSLHAKVAALCASGRRLGVGLKGAREVKGSHRCGDADLVVVRDLSILHDAATIAADVDTTVSFLYVVALGVDVVAEAQLAAASGAPCRLAPSQYLRHVRACEGKATLRVAEQLDVEFPHVRSALRRIARAPGSQIVVRSVVAPAPGGVGAPAPGGVTLRTLRDAVDWAVAARRVENELGPKVLSVEGYRLRC